MEPIANETWRSFRRCEPRRRLLLLLSSLSEAYVGQLGRIMELPHARVLALLEGDPDRGYSAELSLVRLGLAVEKPTIVKRGRVYEITAKGRRKARSMTAGRVRRAVRAQQTSAAPGSIGTGAQIAAGDGASVTWTFSG